MNLQEIVNKRCGKNIAQCTNEEIYYALLEMTKGMAKEKESNAGKRKLYYISAEFLIGKLLSNNLINLGIYEEVKKLLAENGKSLAEIEEVEPEPSLGNGGLGRLAACFVDSIASLGLNGDGVGLNYHYGLFKQVFENNLQRETPNPWIEKESWLTKTDVTYPIQFGGFTLQSRLYDIDVIGYENRTTKLHLFDVETVDESLVGDGIDFDKENIAKNLTLFLYPDDSDDKGRILRVYQQYFMVSNAARLIIDETLARGGDLHKLHEYAAIQINDTHPSMVIPEMIRLLMERGILMDEAIDIVSKTCAYTNHTILAEALEKWPIHFLEKAVPQLLPIIYELNSRIVRKYDDKSVAIIDDEKRVHMAHMDIHYGYSVNGVAYLHTEILKNSELNNFYKIYPEKFNNKTNGITFRRWLLHCNKELVKWVDKYTEEDFRQDANRLSGLLCHMDDDSALEELLKVKHTKKVQLAEYLKETQDLEINPDSIFDIQVKRLHEYKRQQMNALELPKDVKSISAGRYAYETLSDEEKKIYDQMLDAVMNHEEEVTLSTSDGRRLEDIFNCVKADYGGLFWVESFRYTQYQRNGHTEVMSFAPNYIMTAGEREDMQKKIDRRVKNYVKGIKDSADDYEKVKTIYRRLIQKVDYNMDAKNNQNIISVFIGKETVCQGYASAMQYLLEKLEIPCVIVTGMAKGGPHAWNLVQLDGEWYYVDATWGNSKYHDDEENDVKYVEYDYLNITTKEMLQDHSPQVKFALPECKALKNNYFVREKKYFTSLDEASIEKLGSIFKRAYQKGKNNISVKFSSRELCAQAKEYFLTQYHISDYCDGLETVYYKTDMQMNIFVVIFP